MAAAAENAGRFLSTLRAAGISCTSVAFPDNDKARAILEFADGTTQQQRDAAATALGSFDLSDAAHLAWLTTRSRDAAQKRFATNSEYVIERALALIVLQEINTLRSWLRAFKTEVAAATNLANLQTRVAGLPTLNDYSALQLTNAIKAKMADGSAD